MTTAEQHEVRPGDDTPLDARPRVPGAEAALAELPALDGLPVERHVDVYERAHRQLQDAMADTDDA